MLSIVLATHNEAANIERCLESVRPLSGEIIVVDGESTDDTVALATKLGARVISTTNKANFHINKQQAMDAAGGSLILQLDADEVVDADLLAFIKKTHDQLEKGESLPSAWWIRRKNYFFGRFLKKGGQYPDPVIRLYQRGKAWLPQKDVHEQMEVDGEVATAEGHLLHYSNPTFADYVRKMNTYTSFAAQQKESAGTTPSFSHGLQACVIQPIGTFFSLYLRHRGYVDGTAGLLFALCSAFHHPVTYIKFVEQYAKNHRPS